ncbi:MAG: septal ring lytic transglycosylase RlpA family protein [Devosia sp.]|nr:septal ring lytic transglycosylase RlpA family protein [Devosia sp.]
MATDLTAGWRPAARFLGLMALLGPLLAACASNPHHHGRGAFSSREFGVPASRRVTNNPNPPHGGGIAMVGDPYKVHGQWYKPKANPVGYNVTGVASWYGWDFHGRLTANGEIFSANAITGGSPDLPLPSYARVTNLDNGRSLLVRFNDRGPYMAGRVVDLSERAATLLGYADTGTAHVRVQYVSSAPLNGDDTSYLMASLNQSTPPGRPETRLASVEADQILPQSRSASVARSRTAASVNPEMKSVLASVNGLFSYGEAQAEQADVTGAHAAVDAVAAAVPDLQDWRDTTDDDLRAIHLDLGLYEDSAVARDTAMKFATLGAVDEADQPAEDGSPATRLTLTHLKPGVGRQDVLDLVHKLGLKDVVLY